MAVSSICSTLRHWRERKKGKKLKYRNVYWQHTQIAVVTSSWVWVEANTHLFRIFFFPVPVVIWYFHENIANILRGRLRDISPSPAGLEAAI